MKQTLNEFIALDNAHTTLLGKENMKNNRSLIIIIIIIIIISNSSSSIDIQAQN